MSNNNKKSVLKTAGKKEDCCEILVQGQEKLTSEWLFLLALKFYLSKFKFYYLNTTVGKK